jgi:hypothetical protein
VARFASTASTAGREGSAVIKVPLGKFVPVFAVGLTGVVVVTVANYVSVILRHRAVGKVFQPIIKFVPVEMSRVHAVWAWAHKRLEDK